MVYWRILGGMKKEKQVCCRDLTWIWRHLCVCPLIDHGQQPMKMHTEVTLLYELYYSRNCRLPQKHCFIGDPHRSLDDHNQSDYGGK